jgi:hypothetical protein
MKTTITLKNGSAGTRIMAGQHVPLLKPLSFGSFQNPAFSPDAVAPFEATKLLATNLRKTL